MGTNIQFIQKSLYAMNVFLRDLWNVRHYRIGSEFVNINEKICENSLEMLSSKCPLIAPPSQGAPRCYRTIHISGANDNDNLCVIHSQCLYLLQYKVDNHLQWVFKHLKSHWDQISSSNVIIFLSKIIWTIFTSRWTYLKLNPLF